ncbi:MAG: RDD family protein [Pseudomonadota bacterium]
MLLSDQTQQQHCSFFRRLAAIVYDSILLCSVFFFATFILISSLGDGEVASGNYLYNIFLIVIAYLYYSWQWINGRQTLGMRSWGINIINDSGTTLDWKQASLRYIASLLSLALFGFGFLWALFDKNKLAMHDRLSKTKLVIEAD